MTLELPTINDETRPEFGVVDIAPGIRLVKVGCELDMLTGPTLTQILVQELRAQPPGLIVGLRDCQLLGAHGLAALESAHYRGRPHTWLVLAGANRLVAWTLRITEVDRVIPSYRSVATAVRALVHGQ